MNTLNINIYVIQLLYNMLLFNGKMVNLSSQYGHFSVSFSSSWTSCTDTIGSLEGD